ncbi:MAG: 4-(cytidine 5'-diphospho)-2-C-methyl-D-erythritol kinase [Candidatus Accumulibacter sp.]|jgi:4-diphosphocytidyl-2-C-methyl-D-erythritol kinase|nr:4-(cytidine 5'-diphospho)-2-C-methyl-D-erythritol kinase [Accumulibacter sp.]
MTEEAPRRDGHRAYPAPAKLNLFLRVVGRRADGRHLLQTLFRFVDHGDRVFLAPRKDTEIVLPAPLPGVPFESDLTVRAARLLQAETGCREGVEIRVEKSLPMGGGLGGGSSDAATVLIALNRLWQLDLPTKRLQEIGLKLGADVPVFIFGQSAFAEGVGEILHPVDLPPAYYLVVEPPVQVPTAVVFGAPELKRDTPPIGIEDWESALWKNDLEAVAVSRYPAIADALAWLSGHGPAMMSGSGACVFAAFEDEESAQAVARALPAGMRGWVARGLDRHPLCLGA